MKKNESRILGLKIVADNYVNASIAWHRNYQFAIDMIDRLEDNRALTKKQRHWVDNLIGEPLPEPKNPEIYKKLIYASKVSGISPDKARVMGSMAVSAFKWTLSEKQLKFIDSLLEYSENIRINGPWLPDEETILKLRVVRGMAECRNEWWWINNPGVRSSMNQVSLYLIGLDNPSDPTGIQYIEGYHVERLLKSFKTRLEDFFNPRWDIGDQAWVKLENKWEMTTIWSGPKIINGEQYHNCMVGNVFKDVHLKDIKSQRR